MVFEVLGFLASVKELAPLLGHLQAQVELAQIYTRLIGTHINARAKSLSGDLGFDDVEFKHRLSQKNIDFRQLPITQEGLDEKIGSTVLQILLDDRVIYGVDFEKETCQAVIRDVHAAFSEAVFKEIPFEGIRLFLQDAVKVIRDNPELQGIAESVEELRIWIQTSSATAQSHNVEILASVAALSNKFERIVDVGTSNIQLLKPPPDSLPELPVVYVERKTLVAEYLSILKDAGWLSIVGGSGKGKTQIARMLAVSNHYKDFCWISVRGVPSSLYRKHVLDQLVLWCERLTGDTQTWHLYEGGQSNIGAVSTTIATTIGTDGLLIIDDLPDLIESEHKEFLDALIAVLKVLASSGIRIVTTGVRELPSQVRTFLSVSIVETIPPYLTSAEILDMLENANAPSVAKQENTIAVVIATTKGVPIFVAATIRWWQQVNWQWGDSEFLTLLSSDPIRDVQEDYRRYVTRFLDERQREFLYRLSLMVSPIDKQVLWKIAEVRPPITYPQECLDELLSIWIDVLPNERYAITPLLQGSGKLNLSAEMQRDVNRIVASHMLEAGTIEAEDIFPITMYLWGAREDTQLIQFLLEMMRSVKTQSQAKYIDWAGYLFLPDVGWNIEITHAQKIMIRAMQLRVRLLAGRNMAEIDADLEQLITQSTPDDAYAVVFAHANLGALMSLHADLLPPILGLTYAAKAIKAYWSNATLRQLMTENGTSAQMENLIWTQVARLKTAFEIGEFLDLLQSLSSQEISSLFNVDLAFSTSSMVLDHLWMIEGGKPAPDRDWQALLALLDRVETIAKERNLISLQIAEIRTRSLILADYLGRRDEAITLLEAVSPQSDSNHQFLVNYTLGCILFDDKSYRECLSKFEAADDSKTEEWHHFSFALKQFMTIAYGQMKEWKKGIATCIQAIQIARRYDHLQYNRLEMCGELSWLYWGLGQRRKACAALTGLIVVLITDDLSNPRAKEVFNKTGHALGWYVANVGENPSPLSTIDGGSYKGVEAGLFGIQRTGLQTWVPKYGFSKMAMTMMAGWLASSLGQYKFAWKWYGHALKFKDDPRGEVFVEVLGTEALPVAARFGHPSAAIEFGLRTMKAQIAHEAFFAGAINLEDIFDSLSQHTQLWTEAPKEQRIRVERRLLWSLFVPAFTQLLGNLSSLQVVSRQVDLWREALGARQSEFGDLTFWFDVLDLLEHFLAIPITGSSDPSILSKLSIDGMGSLEALSTLVVSAQKGISLKESISQQARSLDFLLQHISHTTLNHVMPGVSRFLHRYWSEVATTKGFSLNQPRLFRQDLAELGRNYGVETAIRIFRRACEAIGVIIPERLSEKLDSFVS